ncbi:MAG: hypothetical protein ACRDD1_10920 [Planctomycetia bacterium]
MVSQLLLPVLRERFPNRGLIAADPPNPCAQFPGIHPGIRAVSIYDDGDEVTLSIDDLTHGHFAEYDEGLSDAERCESVVESVVEFLEALFADHVVVWGIPNVGGGWYRTDLGGAGDVVNAQKFVWSGPLPREWAEPDDASDDENAPGSPDV